MSNSRLFAIAVLAGLAGGSTAQASAPACGVTVSQVGPNKKYTVTDSRTGIKKEIIGFHHDRGDEKDILEALIKKAPRGTAEAALENYFKKPDVSEAIAGRRSAYNYLIQSKPSWVGVESSPKDYENRSKVVAGDVKMEKVLKKVTKDENLIEMVQAYTRSSIMAPSEFVNTHELPGSTRVVPMESEIKDDGATVLFKLIPRLTQASVRERLSALSDSGLSAEIITEYETLAKVKTPTVEQKNREKEIAKLAKGNLAPTLLLADYLLAANSTPRGIATLLVTDAVDRAREHAIAAKIAKQRGQGTLIIGKAHAKRIAHEVAQLCNKGGDSAASALKAANRKAEKELGELLTAFGLPQLPSSRGVSHPNADLPTRATR